MHPSVPMSFNCLKNITPVHLTSKRNYIHVSIIVYLFSIHLECLSGIYGYNCSGMCGHCFDMSYCSHVDGSCQTGCSPGYHGRQCKEGKAIEMLRCCLCSL